MSAVFSINIIVNSRVLFETIINEIDNINKGYRFSLNEIIRIDNWEYQNEIIIPKDSYSLIDNYLEEGKKIIGSGVLKNNTCGFMLWYEKNITCIDFWISTKYISELDSEIINQSNKKIYKDIIMCLTRIFKHFNLKWCIMGIEVEIPEELSFEKSLEHNRNMITCWILPKKCKYEKPESYYIEIVSDFFVGMNKQFNTLDILGKKE
ncbi:MAG: hypothetical protein HDT39_07390 [Lachnospiraceae bacterium]|nr:hypothetical protein [Lachnospiraceae bacterium]